MAIHPYVYCETCQATQPVFYDFENREWVCFVCGHALENPESELEKPDIRENRRFSQNPANSENSRKLRVRRAL